MPTAEEVLQQQADEYKNASAGFWDPPDGTYTGILTGSKMDFIGKAKDVAAVIVGGQIIEGEFDGKEVRLGTFSAKRAGFLKTMVTSLGGEVEGMVEASQFIDALTGQAVQFTVSRSVSPPSEKYPNATTFINYRIEGLLGEECLCFHAQHEFNELLGRVLAA